jgi:hypothetical protein
LGCLTRVAQAQQQVYVPASYLELPHGSLKHTTGYVPTDWILPPCTVAQAQQTGYVPAGYLELPPHGRSSTATGYVPASYLELPCTGRSSTATGYVPASWADCLTGSSSGNRLCTSGLPWAASHGSLKHSNRPCASSYLDCLTGRSNTATECTGALNCPSHGRSSTATGCASWLQQLPHTGRSSFSNRLCTSRLPSRLPCTALKHSNGLCTSRLPWAALHRVAQTQQQAVCQQATLELPHTVAPSTATDYVPAYSLGTLHWSLKHSNRLCATRLP